MVKLVVDPTFSERIGIIIKDGKIVIADCYENGRVHHDMAVIEA